MTTRRRLDGTQSCLRYTCLLSTQQTFVMCIIVLISHSMVVLEAEKTTN